ncbi:MAG: SGNH/GDSL hydrolase family protein [Spirochaetales bacterium]|nr:SGNH/GDSL hydrolase family protein [Spirochaetales bacterium]
MGRISKKKKAVFYIIFILFIVLFFAGLEGLLRLFHSGHDYSPFVIKESIPGYYIDNQQFVAKYHNPGKAVSSTAKNFFPSIDTEETLRGFVIGGSTAQGYPYPSNQSFSKILETALEASGHFRDVSVVNLGFSAMSSFYVKDAVGKIMDYDPDFIVLYTGHNELYGTIGATTGKGYFAKNLYLALKEIRLFQFFFDLLAAEEDRGTGNVNLMAQQFHDNQISIDSELNGYAREYYRRNIKAVIDRTSRRDIPLFIVEPVSNLIDMPPFLSSGDSADKSLYQELKNSYEDADSPNLEQLFDSKTREISDSGSALVAYMAGLIKMKLGRDDYLESLIAAKDLDSAPFRARSSLIRELSVLGSLSERNVHYIPLSEILEQNYGPAIFSNRIFIDHLHFNMEGQKILGRILAEQVGGVFSFSREELGRMTEFLENDEKLRDELHFTDFSEVFPYWSVSSIIMSPPYSEMELKYIFPSIAELFPRNDLAGNGELQRKMFSSVRNTNDIILFIYNYYFENDFEQCLPFINSLIFKYPGNPAGYVFLGDYFSLFERTERTVNTVISSYFKALYLSDFDENTYMKLKKYLLENDETEILDRLNYEYEKHL